MIKATNRGVNILDHVLVKGFWISLQSLKEMKGLGSIFNFYCGQTEIRDKEIVLRFGPFIKQCALFFFFLNTEEGRLLLRKFLPPANQIQ